MIIKVNLDNKWDMKENYLKTKKCKKKSFTNSTFNQNVFIVFVKKLSKTFYANRPKN